MNIVDNEKEMTIIEALEFCVGKDVKDAQKRLESVIKAKKLSTSQKKTLKEILKCYFQNVEIVGGGLKSGKIIVSGCYSDEKERITGNSTNGYKRTENEKIIKEIIFDELIKKEHLLEKYETGLSYSGWATLFGIPEIEESESFEQQAVKHLQECYNVVANDWFKPLEIVNEFQKAHTIYRKAVVKSSFSQLVKEGKIETEIFYIAGVPSADNLQDDFKVITHQEYKEMKELRDSTLQSLGSNLNEYVSHFKKRKDERLRRIFEAVRNTLWEEYGVTRFHESIKVEIADSAERDVIHLHPSIEHEFMKHMTERSITYRHNRDSYKTSTYFWQRFYILNTFNLMSFLGYGQAIDGLLQHQEEDMFNENLKSYLYDFDTSDHVKARIKASGFFGNIEKEAERMHLQRIEGLELFKEDEPKDNVQELIDDTEKAKSNVIELPTGMNKNEKVPVDEIDHYSHFNGGLKKKREVETDQFVIVAKSDEKVNRNRSKFFEPYTRPKAKPKMYENLITHKEVLLENGQIDVSAL